MSFFPEKAYKNLSFLNSTDARPIRILCEYEETRQRFRDHNIHNTIVFFGSARAKAGDEARVALDEARAALAASPDDAALQNVASRAEIAVKLSGYYDSARELARRLTVWSGSMDNESGRPYVICSGGGPGIMEAANRGAADAPDGRSVGLGISLPFEQGVNDWVTPELAFEFHYFFTRKYWFLYPCKALVIFPGGFGTMDELFETLTLVQTGKIRKDLPIILFGDDYWDGVLNIDVMSQFGTISPKDLDLIHRSNTVDDAFEHLVSRLG